MREILTGNTTAPRRKQAVAGDRRAEPSGVSRIFIIGELYGGGGQSRVVVAPRHQHALFHAPLQLPLNGIKPAGKAAAGVFPRQLLFHQRFNVPAGSVRVTPSPGALQAVQFTLRLVAAEPFAHKAPRFRYQFVHLQRLELLLLTLLIPNQHDCAARPPQPRQKRRARRTAPA